MGQKRSPEWVVNSSLDVFYLHNTFHLMGEGKSIFSILQSSCLACITR